MSADISVVDQGSVIGFSGVSEDGGAFLLEALDSEPWQWMGETLWVDHRVAQGVIGAIDDAGLVLEPLF